MAVRKARRPPLDDIPFRVKSVHDASPSDRRDVEARDALISRVQGEFREMPGLSLTVAQAAKLFGLPCEACTRVLSVLEDTGVLRQAGDGQYRLRGNAA